MFQGLYAPLALENTYSDLSKCMLNYKYQEKGKEKKNLVVFLFLIFFKSIFRNRSFYYVFT